MTGRGLLACLLLAGCGSAPTIVIEYDAPDATGSVDAGPAPNDDATVVDAPTLDTGSTADAGLDAPSPPPPDAAQPPPVDSGSPPDSAPPPPPPLTCTGFQAYVVPQYSCLFVNGGETLYQEADGAPECSTAHLIPVTPGGTQRCGTITTSTNTITEYFSDAGPNAIRIMFDGGCPKGICS